LGTREVSRSGKILSKVYALRDKNKTMDPQRLIWVMGGLRNIQYTQGNIMEAIEIQSDMFPLYQKVAKGTRAHTLNNLIKDYLIVFESEREAVLNALEQWYDNDISEPDEKIVLAQRLAEGYAEQKDFDKAAFYTKELLPLVTDERQKIKHLNDIAFYYQQNKDWKESLSYYNTALKKCSENEFEVLEGIQFYKTAYFYYVQKEDKKSQKYLFKSLKQIKTQSDNSLVDYQAIRQLLNILDSKIGTYEWKKAFAKECLRISEDRWTKRTFERKLGELKR
jgi:tetratricopeptide (TPR) repeat protein